MMPTISVVIPLYNKAAHIERAVSSVLAQTFQDFEIIVVDDGSTDNGADIVKVINDPRIILLKQKNAGVSVARNRGIEVAKSDLIAFLDADDEWRVEFLYTILRLRKKYPNAGLYATDYVIQINKNSFRKTKINSVPSAPWEGILPNYFKAATLGEPPVCSSAVCIPKSVFEVVGGFPVGEPLGEDLDMWGRIALQYPVAFSRYIGAIYHQEASNRADTIKTLDSHLPFIRTANKAIQTGMVRPELMADLKEYLLKMQMMAVRSNILSGNPEKARQLFKIIAKSQTHYFKWKKLLIYISMILPNSLVRLAWRIRWIVYDKYRETLCK